MSLLRDLFDLFRSEPDHPATRNPKSKPATRKPARRQKTIVHPIVGEVTLSQSRRARRISLCVRPSGPVRLSYPYGVSTGSPSNLHAPPFRPKKNSAGGNSCGAKRWLYYRPA